jgi:hypothetical protein
MSNDTSVIALRNLGDIPIRIWGIYINQKSYTDKIQEIYMFDSEGDLFFGITIPIGGFGIVKLSTLDSNLISEKDSYNIPLRTNIGIIDEKFEVNNKTFRDSGNWIDFPPSLWLLLIGSSVTTYFYHRYMNLG